MGGAGTGVGAGIHCRLQGWNKLRLTCTGWGFQVSGLGEFLIVEPLEPQGDGGGQGNPSAAKCLRAAHTGGFYFGLSRDSCHESLGCALCWRLPVQLQYLMAHPCRQTCLLQVTWEPGPGCSPGLDAALSEVILWTVSLQTPVTKREHSGLGIVLSHHLVSFTSGCQCGISNVHQDKQTVL